MSNPIASYMKLNYMMCTNNRPAMIITGTFQNHTKNNSSVKLSDLGEKTSPY